MAKIGAGRIVAWTLVGLSGLGWLLDWSQRMEQLAILVGKIPDLIRWLDTHHASLWLYPTLLAAGLLMLWWDVRRRHEALRLATSQGGQGLQASQAAVTQASARSATLDTPKLESNPIAVSREARALAALKESSERANSETTAPESQPAKLQVFEVRNAASLVMGLQLLSPDPTDHYELWILDIARWYDDNSNYSTVAGFAESTTPWEISRAGGAARLHRDVSANYILCTFAANGPYVEYVSRRSRTTYTLKPGMYRVKLEFRRGGHVQPHELFVRVDGKDADFVGNE